MPSLELVGKNDTYKLNEVKDEFSARRARNRNRPCSPIPTLVVVGWLVSWLGGWEVFKSAISCSYINTANNELPFPIAFLDIFNWRSVLFEWRASATEAIPESKKNINQLEVTSGNVRTAANLTIGSLKHQVTEVKYLSGETLQLTAYHHLQIRYNSLTVLKLQRCNRRWIVSLSLYFADFECFHPREHRIKISRQGHWCHNHCWLRDMIRTQITYVYNESEKKEEEEDKEEEGSVPYFKSLKTMVLEFQELRNFASTVVFDLAPA